MTIRGKKIWQGIYYSFVFALLVLFYSVHSVKYLPVVGTIHYTNPKTRASWDIRVAKFLPAEGKFGVRFVDYEGVTWKLGNKGELLMENPTIITRLRFWLGVRVLP